MAVAEEAIKALSKAVERQKATREAATQVASDIAARQEAEASKAPGTEVKR